MKNNVDITGKANGFSTSSFWHYSTADKLDSILAGDCFWINNLSGMNDKNEEKLHEEDKEKVFALCFCNTNSEKIPMWYLYSGICGDGMRMGLTPSTMLKFLSSIQIVHQVTDEKVDEEEFYIGKDFEMQCGWVYYKKYNGCVNFKKYWYTVSDYSENFESGNYFIKDYPWEYEKEFRIVFINKTDKKINRIAVKIPNDVKMKLKLGFAPEIEEENKNEILSKPGFQKYFLTQVGHSDLNIKMDLLQRNKGVIVKNIDQIIGIGDIKDVVKNLSHDKCDELMRELKKD